MSVRIIIGLALSAIFLTLVFFRASPFAMWRAMSDLNLTLILPAVPLYFLAMYWRTLRWKVILKPLGSFTASRIWPVVMIGYAANNVLPARAGDLVRAYYLGQRESISKSSVLGTLFVERIFDGLALFSLVVILLPFLPVIGLFQNLGEQTNVNGLVIALLLAIPFALITGIVAALTFAPQQTHWAVDKMTKRVPGRVRRPVLGFLTRMLAGLASLRNPKLILAAFLLSLPVWLSEAAIFILLAYSLDLEAVFGHWLNLGSSMVLTSAISNLGSTIPSTAGGLGPFEFFVQSALVFFGVRAALASAFAFIVHAILLVPETIVGFLHLPFVKISIRGAVKA